MLYPIFKIIMKVYFNMYYKKIYIEGADQIPEGVPLVFICNHPNSFMEACLLATFQNRPLHFLVRGDMFEKKWLAPILRETNQIPIYRFKDGFEKLRNNKSSFSASFDILAENKCILLFPEGSTEFVPWLRPFQKGAARLATGTIEEKGIDDVFVLPCAVHYFDALETRSTVAIQFGNAISTKEFFQNKNSTDILSDYTNHLYQKMDELVISYPKKLPRKPLDEQLQDAFTRPKSLFNLFHSKESVHSKCKIAMDKFINQNEAILEPKISSSLLRKIVLSLLIFILSILSIPAIILFYPTLFFVKKWSKTLKSIEFQAPTRLAVSLMLHLFISKIFFFLCWYFLDFNKAIVATALLQVSLFSLLILKDSITILKLE